MDELMETDDRLNPEKNPMPFDGKRLIVWRFRSGRRALKVAMGAGAPKIQSTGWETIGRSAPCSSGSQRPERKR
jgi:hypothetical protein